MTDDPGVLPPLRSRAQPDPPDAYWTLDPGEVMRRLHSEPAGLSSAEAARRLVQYGPDELREQDPLSRARVLWNQLRSPLLLLLVFAAGASALTGEWIDAAIVFAILVASVGIGYSREYRAQVAADKLRARVQAVATVLRDARPVTIPLREVVPGDVVMVAAGSLLPADAIVLEATDCFVNESVLTGESFPVEKKPGVATRTSVLTARPNCVFLGTNVRSGTARCLVVATGAATQFGAIAHRLTLRPPETEFDRGIPLDEAILCAHEADLNGVEKLGEIPCDFVRKRLSVVIRGHAGVILVTKGAFEHVLEACVRSADGRPLDAARRTMLRNRYLGWGAQGTRVLAVTARTLDDKPSYGRDDERELDFLGFLTFLDRPKEGVAEALTDLAKLGVSVKLITGDSELVAKHVATAVGMRADRILTGRDLDELHDEALWSTAERTDLFVEVDPNQKERIILSLKKMGRVVGFLGDGVNDAPAMHAADTSLSVDQAVDVAKEAADFVLLERHLDVIRRGILEGRKTFANTLKYVLTTTSANLGNMVSMAVASLFLPFLPLLAGQILLNNFLSDVPAVGLADDSVDPELVERPRRWDMRFIGRFMVVFGVLSSVFDFLTFGTLLRLFDATPQLFRTGWFVESLLTELVIALVVRPRRPFFRSRPGTLLWASTAAIIAVTFAIPFLPFVEVLGFTALPGTLLLTLIGITGLYIGATELAKTWFYRGRV